MFDPAKRVPVPVRAGDHRELSSNEEHPFRHVKVLDQGGSGFVDMVEDPTTGALYARKVIKASRRDTNARQAARTFQNEVGLIKKLRPQHHVIRVHATYIQDTRFGIILSPLADEKDLGAYLDRYLEYSRKQDSEAPDLRLEYMAETLKQAFGCLAYGLVSMHQTGIRHKDIKPSNILLHQSSILYTDFGYSADISHLSQSISNGEGCFTKRYSAPEGMKRDGRNQYSDVYSLGCVFLEIMAALTASHELNPSEIYSANMETIHNHISQMDLPPNMEFLREVVTSMTEDDWMCRPNAATVFQAIVSQPGYCCTACCATVGLQGKSRETWTWKSEREDYCLEAHDDNGRLTSQWLRESPTWRTIQRAACIRHDKTNTVLGHLLDPSSKTLHIRDTTAGAQDVGFRTRQGSDATRFWVIGRVCKQRIFEATSKGTPTPDQDDSSSLQTFHEPVQMSVQCYVVVQVEQSYVYACRISTYHKRGTLGRDCDSSKHAVVYISGIAPANCYLPGEREKGLTKEPIEVKPTDPRATLPSESRIRFFETVRIKNGAEAKDVGRVAAGQRELLRQYWISERGDGDGESWG